MIQFWDELKERYRISEWGNQQINCVLNGSFTEGTSTERPYGSHEFLFDLPNGDIRICRLMLLPGTSTSLHLHERKSHFFLVERGGIRVDIENKPCLQLNKGEYCFIDSGLPHLLSNEGSEPALLLEVMHPATFEDKHVIRHPYLEKKAMENLQALWGDCPDHLLDRFYDLCSRSSSELVANAELSIKKPYGYNHILKIEGDYGFSFMQMNPGQTTSRHYHRWRKEFFYIRSETLTLFKQNNTCLLNRFSTGFSTPLAEHTLSNKGEELLEILEIFTPPLLDDKVRVQDHYDRKVGLVEHWE